MLVATNAVIIEIDQLKRGIHIARVFKSCNGVMKIDDWEH
jgi:GTP cyclohydrolase FolE2